jgi:hypothetical protein
MRVLRRFVEAAMHHADMMCFSRLREHAHTTHVLVLSVCSIHSHLMER